MWLFIEATDIWLFRDGRPFDAGSDHRATSVFPPSPTTIQGAIRSKLLALHGVSVTDYAQGKVVETATKTAVIDQIGTAANRQQGKMRLRGPFIAKRQADDSVMPYFPTPSDILQLSTDTSRRLLPLRPDSQAEFSANWPSETPDLLPCVYDARLAGMDKPEGGLSWISATGMQSYLTGTISTESFTPPATGTTYSQWVTDTETALDKANTLGHVHLKRAEQLFSSEYRLGIGIDADHKRPSDGKLYTTTFVRPRTDVGLLVEVTGVDESKWEKTGVLSLGGERKAARYTRLDAPAHWPENAADGNKLYLAAPTQFSDGWKAADWHAYFPQAGTLEAAIVGRPHLIGGWDMAKNRPKPMRRYVPAASVYFFTGTLRQQTNNDAETAYTPICDDKDAGQIGFGTTFIGRR